MKRIIYRYFPLWMLFGITLSCSKGSKLKGVASLTIVNAVADSEPSLIPNFSGTDPLTWYINGYKLGYGATMLTGSYSGKLKLGIYHYPDTSVHTIPLYNLSLDIPVGTVHTLFLSGTINSPDTLFTMDILPYHPPSDSSVGIRFVNLSKGSTPVSVNIAGAAQGSEVSSLPYKGITAFTNYPATAAVSDYTFEFRDASSGTLIGAYNLNGVNDTFSNTRRFRDLTIALLGIRDDPATQKIILIEAYTPY